MDHNPDSLDPINYVCAIEWNYQAGGHADREDAVLHTTEHRENGKRRFDPTFYDAE